MSFIITVYVNEGIVMASDRRTTWNRMKQDGTGLIGVHTTNSTDKTFLCPNGAGLSTCGEAGLEQKPITGYIREMIRTRIKEDTRVEDMPEIVMDYFKAFPVVPDTMFIAAGYDAADPHVYRFNVRGNEIETLEAKNPGAVWDGEPNTLSRLLNDVSIRTDAGPVEIHSEPVVWQFFTLQDAVDFARYAAEMTIQTMHFMNVVETVGGDVDILVITPDGSKWLAKQELK